jgi:hypothetical protein
MVAIGRQIREETCEEEVVAVSNQPSSSNQEAVRPSSARSMIGLSLTSAAFKRHRCLLKIKKQRLLLSKPEARGSTAWGLFFTFYDDPLTSMRNTYCASLSVKSSVFYIHSRGEPDGGSRLTTKNSYGNRISSPIPSVCEDTMAVEPPRRRTLCPVHGIWLTEVGVGEAPLPRCLALCFLVHHPTWTFSWILKCSSDQQR